MQHTRFKLLTANETYFLWDDSGIGVLRFDAQIRHRPFFFAKRDQILQQALQRLTKI